nr:hypothetical protein [uncultured Ruminococcus sp.]
MTDKKANHNNIENRQKTHLLDFRDDKSARYRADYASVYRQAALVNIKYLYRVCEIIIPLENAEIQSCADYSGNKSDKNTVHQLVEIELKTRSCLVGVENREHKSRRYYQAVPIDLERTQRNRHTADVKLPAEVRKLNVKIFHIKPPYPGS